MATKISGLTELTAPASGDLVAIVDVSDTTMAASGSTRKITCDNLSKAVNVSNVSSGTLPLARGGTGASLSDPNADRILFWDDSAGAVTWLTVGTGLSITDTTLSASGGATALNDIGDATGSGVIAAGDNDQQFTAANTTASRVCYRFTEATAASGSGAILVQIDTIASSTASPLVVSSRTNEIFRAAHDQRQLLFQSGTESKPIIAFSSNAGTGMYSSGTGEISFACGGSRLVSIRSTGLSMTNLSPSPQTGDIWNDTSRKNYCCYPNAITQAISGCVFTQTATVTVANTVTETTLVGSGVGTTTLPAAFFVAGKTIRVRARGYRSTESIIGGAITLKVKAGSTALATCIEPMASVNLTSEEWTLEYEFTCRTTGASGTVIGQGTVGFATEDGFSIRALKNTATVTIDTSASQAVSVTAQWDSADAANTISCTNLTVEVLN